MLGDESLGYLTVIWDKFHEIFRLFIQYRKSKYNCQYHGSGGTFHTFRLEVYHQQQSVTDNQGRRNGFWIGWAEIFL